MIDGSFRENTFGAKYFSQQEFPENEYEVIWVEFYNNVNKSVKRNKKIKYITLDKKGTYHSSFCFNRGISEAKGDILVIPDADQIVPPNFLERIFKIHSKYEKLALYGYRYDEIKKGALKFKSFDMEELKNKCVLKNPINYGGCLTIRKKWMIEINGYEQNPIFQSGNHANGLDIYTRLKNYGLAVQWEPSLILYHPWHHFTLNPTMEHVSQQKIIEWRKQNMIWKTFNGIDQNKNIDIPFHVNELIKKELHKTKLIKKIEDSIIFRNLPQRIKNRLAKLIIKHA